MYKIIDIGVSFPPIVYFLALIAAGFGVSVNEDALCIFIGSIFPLIPSTSSSTSSSAFGNL